MNDSIRRKILVLELQYVLFYEIIMYKINGLLYKNKGLKVKLVIISS